MLSTAYVQYTMRLCAGVFSNWLYMLSWVTVSPEGCEEINCIHLATHGHRAMTGTSPLTVLTGSQSKVDSRAASQPLPHHVTQSMCHSGQNCPLNEVVVVAAGMG